MISMMILITMSYYDGKLQLFLIGQRKSRMRNIYSTGLGEILCPKELGSCDAFEDKKSGVHSGLNEELFTSCTLSGIRRDSIATMLCNHYNMSVLL